MSDQPAYVLQRRTTRRRSSGSDIEWRLLQNNEIVLTGFSSGRLFAKGADFAYPDGRVAFTVASTRSVLPKTWIARGPDDRELVTLELSSLKRGKTSVSDNLSGRVFTLQSVDSIIADAAKSAVLAGTERFSIRDGDAVVGEINSGIGRERQLADAARSIISSVRSRPGPFSKAETLTILDSAWQPSPVLVGACLAFRSVVISFVRSP